MATVVDGAIEEYEEPKLITAPFVLGWLVNFTQYLCFYFLITVMALYAIKSFSVSEAAAGFAASAFVVGATFARFFAGWAVDRFGKRPILLIALVFGTAAATMYVPAQSFELLIVVRLIHGFTYSISSTAVMALVQSVIPPSRRAEGTGYFALGSTLSTALGPAAALMVVNSLSYEWLFWITVASSALGLLLAYFIKKPEHLKELDKNKPKIKWSIKTVFHPAVMPIGIFMLMVGFSYAGILTYINGFAEVRGLVAGAGLFFIAYAISMLVMRLFLGKIQDKHGADPIMYFGLVTFAISLVLMSVANQDWHVVVAGAFCGLGYGTLMPAAQAIAVANVPSTQVGSGISTLFLFTDLGVGLGPVILGFILTATGYGTMYALLAGLLGVAAVFYGLSVRQKA